MPPVPKIAKLPEEIRNWLHSTLVKRAFGDIQGVTEELQAMLREANVAVYIGKSAVGAESQKLKRAQESIRASTEAAKLLAASAEDSTDARGEAVMALVTTEMFEVLLQVREADDEDDPVARLKLLAQAGKTVGQLSRARVNQARHRQEVEDRTKAAADEVERLATKGGASAETIAAMRASVMNIAVPRPAAQRGAA
jgi:hypothetical protein